LFCFEKHSCVIFTVTVPCMTRVPRADTTALNVKFLTDISHYDASHVFASRAYTTRHDTTRKLRIIVHVHSIQNTSSEPKSSGCFHVNVLFTHRTATKVRSKITQRGFGNTVCCEFTAGSSPPQVTMSCEGYIRNGSTTTRSNAAS